MNILIVGLGSIGRKHVEALKLLKLDANIFALRSSLNADNQDGIQNIYKFDDPKIAFDFAIISNPTHLHYEFIEKLARMNIPLFIEKPAVNSLVDTDQLLNIIKEKNLITYVACNLRFHPCIIFLKNKIEVQPLRINELNVYCGSYLPNWRPEQDFRNIYSADAQKGGGVHLDLFHEIDYTTWLFGLPNKSKSVLKNNSSLQINAFDYANYIFEYNTFTASIILNYYRRKTKREIEIVFDNDTWKIDLINNEIINDANEYIFKASNFAVNETYVSQLEYFVNCLKNNQIPMNSFQDSLENLKLILSNE